MADFMEYEVINVIDVNELYPSEDELRQKFINTPLEPYIEEVYGFWLPEPLIQISNGNFGYVRKQLIQYIEECIQLAKCIEKSKDGVISGSGWKLSAMEDYRFILAKMETRLVDKLYGFEIIFRNHLPEDSDNFSTMRNWAVALSDFPRISQLKINDSYLDENRKSWEAKNELFTKEDISIIVKKLQNCRKVAKGFVLEYDYNVTTRFLSYMLLQGVPRTRKVYRELYRALDMYGCIPDDIKKSHKTTSSSDPQSNYIKSYVTTIDKIWKRDEQSFDDTNP